jgi:hypothetical protein
MLCCSSSKIALTLVAGVAGGFMLQSSLAPTNAIQPEDGASEYDAEMMAMIQLGTPGEHHEALNRAVGSWDAHVEFYGPDGSVMAGDGTMTSKWVLDGRYVMTNFDMPDFMGAPFNGIAFNGYDNFNEEYVGVWMDSMSTGIMYQKSTLDEGTFVTVSPNGHGGTMKTVSTMDEDSGTDIFFDKLEDGSWHKSGTITYTRQ